MQQSAVSKKLQLVDVPRFSLLCWGAYFFTYFGRYSYLSAMSGLVKDSVLSKSAAGGVASAFFLSYAVAQVLCGFFADRLSARRMVFFGMLCSGLCNALFCVMPTPSLMIALWAINGLAQGMIWPPLMRLCAALLHGNQCAKLSVDLTSSSPVSMVLVYCLSALLLPLFSWRFLFLLCAGLLTSVSFVWLIVSKRLIARAQPVADTALVAPAANAAPAKNLWQLATSAGLIFIGMACIANGVLKDGVFTWVPTYLMENFDLSTQSATLLTTVLPLVNVSGVYLARALNRGWLRNEVATSAILFALAAVALLLMNQGSITVLGTTVLFAVATSLMVGANSALVGLMPLHFRRQGRVAFATGMLNACIHGGSAISGLLFGLLLQRSGWVFLRQTWCIVAVLGALLCLTQLRRWRAFRCDDIL